MPFMLIPLVYTLVKKFINLSTIDEMHLKHAVKDGSVVNGLGQHILFSFLLDKLPSYKLFCKLKTTHFKKLKKPCFEYCNILYRR